MKVTRLSSVVANFEDLIVERERANPRTGLHVSSLVKSMMKVLEPRRFDRGEPLDYTRVTIGEVFEELLAERLGQRLGWVKPKPRTVDGITGSPDGHTLHPPTIDEIKLTWLSAKTTPVDPKMLVYLLQVKAYAYMWETNRVRLWVGYINGDYKPPRPLFVPYVLRFTDRELSDNWGLLRQWALDEGWLRMRRGVYVPTGKVA